ncbi:hypothetical protein ACH5BF_07685 [Arcobacter sp. YIC-464]|uniref:hypothetical protein n=1 Tax=Arcobacter sp. YIC-464 TaxID=3376631 RepID=UPI003C260BC3
MNFKDLSLEEKKEINQLLLTYANSIGGVNFFLQLLDDIKKETNFPLLNKSNIYHFSKGKVSWNKSIYKDTKLLLHNYLKNMEKDEKYLSTVKPKEKKNIDNMMRTLKPVEVKVRSKNNSDEGFSFSIIDFTDEQNIKVSLPYKIIFFYNKDFAKQALNFKA